MLRAVESLLQQIENIDDLCTISSSSAKNYQELLKRLYDGLDTVCRRKVGPLSMLTIDGFDSESIWEQLQTRNAPLLRSADKLLRKLHKKLAAVSEGQKAEISNIDRNGSGKQVTDITNNGLLMDADEIVPGQSSDETEPSEDSDNFSESSDGSDAAESSTQGDTMEEEEDMMEAYLDREDELEINRQYKADLPGGEQQNDDEEGSEAEDLRFVQGALYDTSDEGSDADEEQGPADYRFEDFFVADKGKQGKKGGGTIDARSHKRNMGGEDSDEGSEDSIEGDEDDEQDSQDEEESSGEEEDQERASGAQGATKIQGASSSRRARVLTDQISELEEQLMAEKPWELRGEVKGSDRPENSFLDLHADIERTSKPAPIVTQAFTSSMEEMIKRRIKEGNFSDVLPPPPRKEGDQDGAGDLELSQEKSKLGLGEIYAEDFLAKSLNAQPEAVSKKLEQDRVEAQELFHKVSRQLDALSHFHFTPRPVVAESRVRSMQPAASAVASLQLEDITPVTAHSTGASQQAPEEVLQKKRGIEASLMADEELTAEDRKRKRKASKAANRAKKARAADDAMQSATSSGQPSAGSLAAKAKEDSRALDEQLRHDSRVTLTSGSKGSSAKKLNSAGETGTAFSKSSSFFSKLQQESSDKIREKSAANTKGGKAKVINPFSASAGAVKL